MRKILVTGANKGIGLAIARRILAEHEDTFVFLGARDRGRGEAGLRELSGEHAGIERRAVVVPLDVTSDASVAGAVACVRDQLAAGERLYGLVNNAGVGTGPGVSLGAVLEVNTVGVRRVCEAFLPLLDPKHGRIVNVTSAAGPSFVAECSEARRRFFLDPTTDWADLEALMRECILLGEDEEAFRARGLGKGDAYGLSKACTNTYTLQLARRHPELAINACTPGFIETDMTRRYASAQGKSPAELGMKRPEEGASSALYLLFGTLEGNGRYYGSDAKRSPLDRYRSPGSPAYSEADRGA